MTRILTLRRSETISIGRRRDSDGHGSKWLTRTEVELCDGMLLPLVKRARQDGRWVDSV